MKTENRSVIVSGASSGIGLATAKALAREGFKVFAGVRSDKDVQQLNSLQNSNISPVLLDITKQQTVEETARLVAGAREKLHGIVNNAGIVVQGPVEFVDIDKWREQFEVNLFGHVAVTQAFLPQLRETRGRIVNISSVSGLVAMPMMGPYAASKFSLEAMSDSLRVELRQWGIKVILVEPGSVSTKVWQKYEETHDQLQKEFPPQAYNLYESQIRGIRNVGRYLERTGMPAEKFARTIVSSLLKPNPKARYLVGPGSFGMWLMRHLPTGLRDKFAQRYLQKFAKHSQDIE